MDVDGWGFPLVLFGCATVLFGALGTAWAVRRSAFISAVRSSERETSSSTPAMTSVNVRLGFPFFSQQGTVLLTADAIRVRFWVPGYTYVFEVAKENVTHVIVRRRLGRTVVRFRPRRQTSLLVALGIPVELDRVRSTLTNQGWQLG